MFVLYAMAQITSVGNSVFLGFWSAQSIKGFSEGRRFCFPSFFLVLYLPALLTPLCNLRRRLHGHLCFRELRPRRLPWTENLPTFHTLL